MRDDYAQEKADPAWTSRPPVPAPSKADLHHVFLQQRIKEALGRGDMRTVRMLAEQDAVGQTRPVEPSEFQPTDLAVPGLQSALSTLASAPGRAMVGGALRAAPGAMVNVAKQAKSLPLRASTDYQKNALWKALSGEEPSAAQKLNAMIRNRTMPDPRVTLESRTGDTKLTNQFWTPQNEFGYTPQMKRMLSKDQTIPDEQFAAKMWGQNLDDYLDGQTRKDFPGFSLDESGMPARMGGKYLWPEEYAAKMDARFPTPPAGRPYAWPARPAETVVDSLPPATRSSGASGGGYSGPSWPPTPTALPEDQWRWDRYMQGRAPENVMEGSRASDVSQFTDYLRRGAGGEDVGFPPRLEPQWPAPGVWPPTPMPSQRR